MARQLFFKTGYVVLTWMVVMFFPFLSYSDQEDLTKELDALLATLNVPHKQNISSMIEASQVWRRAPGQERWQLKDLSVDKKTEQLVFSQLQRLDLIDAILPGQNNFEYALLLGATIPRMEKRLKHLVELWEKGIRFNKIVFLTGLRPLTPEIDQTERLMVATAGPQASKDAAPANELEGAEMVYRSTQMPDAMRRVPVEYISTPRRWENSRWHRANTRDTAETWINSHPKPGSVLVMSEQPNAHYQLEVIRQELPDTFPVELAARAALPETRLVIFLDALALWLHNIQDQPQRFIKSSPGHSEITVSPARH